MIAQSTSKGAGRLEPFRTLFEEYRQRVGRAGHHDARRQTFFALANRAFDIDLDDWLVEEKVYRGWVDAILGSLVFEFKTDVHRELEDAHSELRRYLSELWRRNPDTVYTSIVTDGIQFLVYRSELQDGEVRLEEVSSCDLSTVDTANSDSLERCYYWLDALLAPFNQPTSRANCGAHHDRHRRR